MQRNRKQKQETTLVAEEIIALTQAVAMCISETPRALDHCGKQVSDPTLSSIST